MTKPRGSRSHQRTTAYDAPPDVADKTLEDATATGDYGDQLGALLLVLAREIDTAEGHGKAALCRVYLDALRAKRDAEKVKPVTDEVDEIIGSIANTNARRLSVV